MARLVESVPNFSEGRRPDVVDRLAAAVRSTPGVHLLDRTSDASHNRSVLTLAGDADAVAARARGDGRRRRRRRSTWSTRPASIPRIGAVDVIPFVPLGDTTMDDASRSPARSAARIAERFELPVYLYARAAMRPDREKLADVRRGQYEGLKAEIGTDPDRRPDFGPVRTHPTAGAVAVGARPFLIAYNINLASTDLELAKRIARTIRESGGGLPKVQANGFRLDDPDCAQVSMNLLDFAVTPLWRVWEAVAAEARAAGVEPAESELIGLAPLAAFLDVADHAGAPPEASGRGPPGRRRDVPPAARLLAAPGARAAAAPRPRPGPDEPAGHRRRASRGLRPPVC